MGRLWSEQDKDVVEMFYPALGSGYVSELLRRTPVAVKRMAYVIGVKSIFPNGRRWIDLPKCSVCGAAMPGRSRGRKRETCGDAMCTKKNWLAVNGTDRGSLTGVHLGSTQLRRRMDISSYEILVHYTKTHCDWCEQKLSNDNRVAHHSHKSRKYKATICYHCNIVEGYAPAMGAERFEKLSQMLCEGGAPCYAYIDG